MTAMDPLPRRANIARHTSRANIATAAGAPRTSPPSRRGALMSCTSTTSSTG
ncbi:uncharacterized protein SOCEGT47_080100 [Sorangium cellulosum]|uniref:Uncharacterized protein n=1 Tax=Sorangium cellulosum TaxID=56 RepID=A0A4P2QDD7_SORCE|nr:uncharacterized protein SOCEGT47_080100 [Sorangium cellulosum]